MTGCLASLFACGPFARNKILTSTGYRRRSRTSPDLHAGQRVPWLRDATWTSVTHACACRRARRHGKDGHDRKGSAGTHGFDREDVTFFEIKKKSTFEIAFLYT